MKPARASWRFFFTKFTCQGLNFSDLAILKILKYLKEMASQTMPLLVHPLFLLEFAPSRASSVDAAKKIQVTSDNLSIGLVM